MQTIEITIECPCCSSINIVKNGSKSYSGSQNYKCNACGRQFITDYDKVNKGCKQGIEKKILKMLVRGCGVRDIADIEGISTYKILSVIEQTEVTIIPKQRHYKQLEVDEFWTYVGKKKNKKWLIYAYDRETGEIVAWVWGKRDAKTAKALRSKLDELGLSFDEIATDDWKRFKKAFKKDKHLIGKRFTVGIEGNNCRLRHRSRRFVRKTCCFSKSWKNHQKTFLLIVFFINFGFI